MTLLLFSAVLFLIAVTGPYLFGDIGLAITAFFLGLFGYGAYPFFLVLVYFSVVLIAGRKFLSGKWLLRCGLMLLAVFLIVHAATANFAEKTYGGYLSACWNASAWGVGGSTGGGVVLGVVVFPFCALFGTAGSYVFFALLAALALYFFLTGTPLRRYIFP